MPCGITALSTHPALYSRYRGPLLRLDGAAGADDAKAKADADAKAKADADAKAKADADKAKNDTEGRITKLVEERNEARKKLKEYEDRDKAAEDEKAKKKGEYEKLLGERDTALKTLTEQAEGTKKQVEAYEKVLNGQLDAALKGISDDAKRKTVEKLLDGKPLADKVALLPEVLQAVGAQSSGSFGGATMAGNNDAKKTDKETKQKRFDELLLKATREKLTPQEKQEKDKLAKELTEALKT